MFTNNCLYNNWAKLSQLLENFKWFAYFWNSWDNWYFVFETSNIRDQYHNLWSALVKNALEVAIVAQVWYVDLTLNKCANQQNWLIILKW